MSTLVSAQTAGAQPITAQSTTAQHTLGDVTIQGHNAYTYAQAGAAITAADIVSLTAGFVTAAGTGYTAGISVTSGNYFWIPKTVSPF